MARRRHAPPGDLGLITTGPGGGRLPARGSGVPRIVVIGAGIGGLAAAHRLRELAAARGLPLEVVVLEGASRPGGVLGSEAHHGLLLERGPDTLVTHKPAGVDLCRRLGLGDQLRSVPTGRSDVLHRGRLWPVPAGFAILAPLRRGPFVVSPLLSWAGKLRALGEPWVPPRPRAASPESAAGGLDDESVGSFVRRRFGSQIVERLTEPLVGAIYMADVERLSLAATLPRFLALERAGGNLTGRKHPSPPGATPSPASPGGPPAAAQGAAAPFVAPRQGLQTLLDALVAALEPGALRLDSPVQAVRREADGFRIELANALTITAEAVLFATPAHVAAALLHGVDPRLAARLGQISYASCATVNMAWPRRAAATAPAQQGIFVSRTAGLPLVAASLVSNKFPHRLAPGTDDIVVRAFFGGALHPEIDGQSDAELARLATATLAPLLGLQGPATWSVAFRHPRALPQPEVGHLTLVENIRQQLRRQPELAGLDLTGGPTGAYGVPDSIAAGEAAAERLVGWIDERRQSASRPVERAEPG